MRRTLPPLPSQHLKSHRAAKHNIDPVWFHCDVEGCTYKAKQKGDLKRHKTFKHDIGVVWYSCTAEGCDYKSKQTGNLKQHMKRRHKM